MYLEVTDSEAIANHGMRPLVFVPILAKCDRTIENKNLLLSSRRSQFGVSQLPGISSSCGFGCGGSPKLDGIGNWQWKCQYRQRVQRRIHYRERRCQRW